METAVTGSFGYESKQERSKWLVYCSRLDVYQRLLLRRPDKKIRYSRKYWWSLNLAVWPQTERKKYWHKFGSSARITVYYIIINIASASVSRSVFIRERCLPLA